MKFKQYLTEAEDFDKFLSNIKSDCSDFLNDTKKPFWRGVRKSNTFSVDEANENRKPKDSADDLFFNNGFNLALEEMTKIPLIRTKAMFCTSGFSQTTIYGAPHFIFPSNGCKYIFSNEVYDSYEDIHLTSHEYDTIFQNDWSAAHYILLTKKDLTIDKCLQLAKEKGFDSKDVKKFIKDLSSIFSGDYGYIISNDAGKATEKKVTHEILCVGSKKFYKINVEFLRKQLKMKDDKSAVFYDNMYLKILEKINA